MEIALNFDTHEIYSDYKILLESFEKESIISWLNTNEHILLLFLTGVRLGRKYDAAKEYQYDE
jgi:hypothetical protein